MACTSGLEDGCADSSGLHSLRQRDSAFVAVDVGVSGDVDIFETSISRFAKDRSKLYVACRNSPFSSHNRIGGAMRIAHRRQIGSRYDPKAFAAGCVTGISVLPSFPMT